MYEEDEKKLNWKRASPTCVPIAQKIIDKMHEPTDIQRPDSNRLLRRRCRYLVYRSSNWGLSPGKRDREEEEGGVELFYLFLNYKLKNVKEDKRERSARGVIIEGILGHVPFLIKMIMKAIQSSLPRTSDNKNNNNQSSCLGICAFEEM